MKKMQLITFVFATVAVYLLFALSGCGGGGDSEAPEVFHLYDFSGPVIVNYIDKNGNKGYVSLDITLRLESAQDIMTCGNRAAVIRHATTVFLRAMEAETLADLVDRPEDLGKAIAEAIKEVAKIEVKEVYFKNYVMQ